jgi:hypothetical protein
MIFDRAWFDRHQRSLVAACQVPGLGRELRAALGFDLPGRVVRILPHAYIVEEGPTRMAEFRTHPRFARRLHAEYLPIWKLAHWFDQHVANPFIPALNLGFDTLTAYPDANPETTTVDGYVGRIGVNETFATIVAGAGTGGTDDAGTDVFCYLKASATTDQYDQLRRLFFLFDTSTIGAGSTISATTCSLWGIGKDAGLGQTDLAIVSSNPAANTALADADFSTLGSTSFGSVAFGSFTSNNTAYTDIAMNASGLAAISQTGITKYGARLDWDRSGTFGGVWGAGLTAYYQVDMADNASGTAKAPKLVVTFSGPFLLVSN